MVPFGFNKGGKDMPSEEIAAMGFITVKAGKEDEYFALVQKVVATTKAEDKGCIDYAIVRRKDKPQEFIFYERWNNIESARTHIARLVATYGPPSPKLHPALPGAFFEPCEKWELFWVQAA